MKTLSFALTALLLSGCNPLGSTPSTDSGFGALATPAPSAAPIPFRFVVQSASVPSSASSLIVNFDASASGALLPSTGLTGFAVAINGAAATILSATRTGALQVTLAFSVTVGSTDTVTLSYSSGNVTDSESTPLPAFSAQTVANASSFDTDAATYFNAVTTNSGTLSSAYKTAAQSMITSLKAANLWPKLIEIYPFGGDQLSAALVKLKTDSASSPTLTNHGFAAIDYQTTSGLQGDGVSKYTDTNLSVSGLSRYDISFGAYVSADGSNANQFSIVMGSSYNATGDNDRFYIMGSGFSGTNGQPGLGNFYPNGVMNGVGLRTVTYNGTTVAGLRNGTVASSSSTSGIAWQQPGTVFIYRGAGAYFTDGRVPFAFVGHYLTPSEVATLSTIVQTFETALGRNI